MKVCNKCHGPQPLDRFAVRKDSRDGLQHTCRECNNALRKVYRYNRKSLGPIAVRYKYFCPDCGSGCRSSTGRYTVCTECKTEWRVSEHGLVTRLKRNPVKVSTEAEIRMIRTVSASDVIIPSTNGWEFLYG